MKNDKSINLTPTEYGKKRKKELFDDVMYYINKKNMSCQQAINTVRNETTISSFIFDQVVYDVRIKVLTELRNHLLGE